MSLAFIVALLLQVEADALGKPRAPAQTSATQAAMPDAAAPSARWKEGQVIDRGRIVTAKQIVQPPDKDGVIHVAFVYEFKRDDGSIQQIAEKDGEGVKVGTEALILAGDQLHVVDARAYRKTNAAAATNGSVVVVGRKRQTVSEAAETATGAQWNNIYCQSEVTLGSHMPRRTCLTLRDWDMRHQEFIRLKQFFTTLAPGRGAGGFAGVP